VTDDDSVRFYTPRTGTLWGKLKDAARQMRQQPTSAEDLLWQRIRNRQLHGAKFRRQHAIDRFIVDFFCAEAHLVIEVDGAVHDETVAEDTIRQEFLELSGLRVMRFSNGAIFTRLDEVTARIAAAINERGGVV
jgi:very-short-patch-repair endonuclease